MATDRQSAMAAIAADLGREVAHTLGGAPGETPGGDLFAEMDEGAAAFDGGAVRPPKRGRGRPPGSRNRSTDDVIRWMAARGYRDPLEFLASIYTADPRELAADLAGHGDPSRVTLAHAAEVLAMQIRAATEAAAYVHQQAPKRVEVRPEGPRPLVMMVSGMPAIAGMDAEPANIVIDQQVTADPAPWSRLPPPRRLTADASHGAEITTISSACVIQPRD